MMRRTLALLVILTIAGTAMPAARQASLEYDVKAAFLLNFVRYVSWPPGQRRDTFHVCVLGANPFGKRLQAALAGETWEGIPIELRQVDERREVVDCQVLYVPAAATDRFVSMTPELSQRPVLTIGETRAFLSRGGMIQLFIENNKLRFSVNLGAAETAGLQVSSRLLRLAREVVNRRELGK